MAAAGSHSLTVFAPEVVALRARDAALPVPVSRRTPRLSAHGSSSSKIDPSRRRIAALSLPDPDETTSSAPAGSRREQHEADCYY